MSMDDRARAPSPGGRIARPGSSAQRLKGDGDIVGDAIPVDGNRRRGTSASGGDDLRAGICRVADATPTSHGAVAPRRLHRMAAPNTWVTMSRSTSG
jgi:hypothetical protein